MTREFTEFQARAITADGQDICVAAGAGSGKTGVLVERFVRIVVQSKRGDLPSLLHAGVDQILVITFTEKATREMKTRIVAQLNQLGLTAERRQIETAYISTIHGFCSRLLQENPFEAGVDPKFTVLEEAQARRLLRHTFEEVIAQAYAVNRTGITELVAATQSARPFGEEGGDPMTVLASAVESALAKLRGAGRRLSEVERHWLLGRDRTAAHSLEPVWATLTPLLNEIQACAHSLALFRAGTMDALEIARCALIEHAARLSPRAVSLEETLTALEAIYKAVSRARPRPVAASLQQGELLQILQRVRSACEGAKELFGMVAGREEQAALTCHQLWELILAVWRAYDAAKRRLGKLDSEDLQAEGVRLLEEAPGVRNRYRRRFRHLMVDEFQDTNPLQMRLIELLHTPIDQSRQKEADIIRPLSPPTASSVPSHAEGAVADETQMPPMPNFLFVVGDVQQSIYGFRHADSSLFRELERRFRAEGAGLHIPLAVNFRSRPEILRAVERIFRQVWRDEPTPFVPLAAGTSFDPKPAPSLELLLTQNLARKDYVRLEADALAARIQRMVEAEEVRLTHPFDPRRGESVAYRDVAILLRSLTDIQKYEEAFARRGVPYFVVGGGRGYYARHEIRDLLNVLTVLDTPLDDVALAATLRSPLVGADLDTLYRLAQWAKRPLPDASDDAPPLATRPLSSRSRPLYPALPSFLASGHLPAEEAAKLIRFLHVIEALRAQEDRLPVGHLLERLIAQTHYDARLLCRPGGRRRLANVRKLLQMANGDSVMGVRDFAHRLRDLEKLSDREGDAPTEEEAADVVRFLTIHGAKGLEFPVVVLADLSRSLEMPERGLFVCDPPSLALGTRLGGEPNIVYKAIDQRRKEADRQEYNRLLYVAMTRAREHLIFCGNLGRNRSYNWGDNLFALLGLLESPLEPETQIVAGGIAARVAPLAHYLQAPPPGRADGSQTARRQAEAYADQLANAFLQGKPMEDWPEED